MENKLIAKKFNIKVETVENLQKDVVKPLLDKIDRILNKSYYWSDDDLKNSVSIEEDYKKDLLRNSGKYVHNGKTKRRILGW